MVAVGVRMIDVGEAEDAPLSKRRRAISDMDRGALMQEVLRLDGQLEATHEKCDRLRERAFSAEKRAIEMEDEIAHLLNGDMQSLPAQAAFFSVLVEIMYVRASDIETARSGIYGDALPMMLANSFIHVLEDMIRSFGIHEDDYVDVGQRVIGESPRSLIRGLCAMARYSPRPGSPLGAPVRNGKKKIR